MTDISTFYFPKQKLRKILDAASDGKSEPNELETKKLNDIFAKQKEFDFQNRKYLGLHFFAGLFQTEGGIHSPVYKARVAFAQAIENLWDDEGFQKDQTYKEICIKAKAEKGEQVGTNRKMPMTELLSHLPVISWFCHLPVQEKISKYANKPAAIYQNMIHSVANPLLIVKQTLLFIELALYRLFEIFTDIDEDSNFLSKLFKGLVCLIFTVINVCLSPFIWIVDRLIYQLIYQPLEFFILSCVQSINECGRVDLHMFKDAHFEAMFPTAQPAEDVPLIKRSGMIGEDEEAGSTDNYAQAPIKKTPLSRCHEICEYEDPNYRGTSIGFFSVPRTVITTVIRPYKESHSNYTLPSELNENSSNGCCLS